MSSRNREFVRSTIEIKRSLYEKIEAQIERRPGLSKKAIINKALNDFFDPLPKEGTNESIEQMLRKVLKLLQRLAGTQEISIDMLGVFVQVWLCHIPEVPEDEKTAAQAQMKRRFESFKDLVLNEMSGGLKDLTLIAKRD